MYTLRYPGYRIFLSPKCPWWCAFVVWGWCSADALNEAATSQTQRFRSRSCFGFWCCGIFAYRVAFDVPAWQSTCQPSSYALAVRSLGQVTFFESLVLTMVGNVGSACEEDATLTEYTSGCNSTAGASQVLKCKHWRPHIRQISTYFSCRSNIRSAVGISFVLLDFIAILANMKSPPTSRLLKKH